MLFTSAPCDDASGPDSPCILMCGGAWPPLKDAGRRRPGHDAKLPNWLNCMQMHFKEGYVGREALVKASALASSGRYAWPVDRFPAVDQRRPLAESLWQWFCRLGVTVRIPHLFPVYLHVMLVITGALLIAGKWASWREYISLHRHLVMALVAYCTVTFSIFCHEIVHAITARCFGMNVKRISLFGIGGFMQLDETSPGQIRKWQAVAMLASGPAINLAMFACFLVAFKLISGTFPTSLHEVLASACRPSLRQALVSNGLIVNFLFGTLNLVPAFPLDGGRIVGLVIGGGTNQGALKLLTLVSATTASLLVLLKLHDPIGAGVFAIVAIFGPSCIAEDWLGRNVGGTD